MYEEQCVVQYAVQCPGTAATGGGAGSAGMCLVLTGGERGGDHPTRYRVQQGFMRDVFLVHHVRNLHFRLQIPRVLQFTILDADAV